MPDTIPVSGQAVPELTVVDSLVETLMTRHGVWGAAVAVAREGRLVYSRGFGFADATTREPVQPEAVFRLASLSKSVTAAAILELIEDGLLSLDDQPFEILSDLEPAPGASVDPRLAIITVQDLLEHAGGWDQGISGDATVMTTDAAEAFGLTPPADSETIARYALGIPLDFDPGARHSYANLGYVVLGLVVEEVSGLSYEDFVRAEVLEPAGVTTMRLGRTRPELRAPGEVVYHHSGSAARLSVFPGQGIVPEAYGGFYLEAFSSAGAWTGSAADVLRFLVTVDGRTPPADLLSSSTIAAMSARPDLPTWQGTSTWYGFGWNVQATPDDALWWHTGILAGTTNLMVRAPDDVSWVVLTNTTPSPGPNRLIVDLFEDMDAALGTVAEWPAHDLFETVP